MDLTLSSDLYNNLKFNMHKLILDLAEDNYIRLAAIFGADEKEVKQFLDEFHHTCTEEAEELKKAVQIPDIKKIKTFAFVGDSITSDRESYLNIFKEYFKGQPEIKIVDAAISGDKSDDARMKFYFRVMNHKPDVVHILLGTNDMRQNADINGEPSVSLQDYQRNLEYMVSKLKSENVDIILSTIPPVDNQGLRKRFPDDYWIYDTRNIAEVNKIIADIAKRYQVKLNDMGPEYERYLPEEILLADGLHLNRTGQKLLAQKLLKAFIEFV